MRGRVAAAAPEGVEPLAAQVAASRGVADLDAYFSPRFAGCMPRPETLLGMDEAVDRLCLALASGECIGIIGDYDCDGATSTAIVVRALRLLGHGRVAWRIPHRIRDGYGPNDRLVDELRDGEGATLLLVLDSGTAALGPVAHARSRGMDVVIVDHHEPGESLPDAILVNPKRRDETGDLSHLCTAGLAFLFCVAILARLKADGLRGAPGTPPAPDLRPLLGLVALGTVADVVPLTGLNRAYVALGMRRMDEVLGLRTLMSVIRREDPKLADAGERPYDARTLSHMLGPCLNAAGRLGDMHEGVELLLGEDPARAEELATRLHGINRERRTVQDSVVEEARAMVRATGQDGREGVILVGSESWHPGVVGLVASRLREAFDKPAAAWGQGGKGSARSVEGFNFGRAIMDAQASGVIPKGGGHAMAAGFNVAPGGEEAFRAHLQDAARGLVQPPLDVDLVASPGQVQARAVCGFSAMEPLGEQNRAPRVAVVGGVVTRVEVLKGKHVKAWLSGPLGETPAITFSSVGTALGEALLASEGRRVDAVGTLDVDEFRGRVRVTLKVEDVMVAAEAGAAAGEREAA